jgi:hypothetical protein
MRRGAGTARITAILWENLKDRHLMEKYADELRLLVELDQRHDELLRELEELDRQVEAVLALWLAEREARREAA